MTQEDKKLLLKDLSARLPYGIVLDVDTTDWKAPQRHIQVKIEGIGIIFNDMSLIVNGCNYGDNYKPYLRRNTSMTEEEKKELWELLKTLGITAEVKRLDWLVAHHFDIRNLIEKGLALEAPKGMYNV